MADKETIKIGDKINIYAMWFLSIAYNVKCKKNSLESDKRHQASLFFNSDKKKSSWLQCLSSFIIFFTWRAPKMIKPEV